MAADNALDMILTRVCGNLQVLRRRRLEDLAVEARGLDLKNTAVSAR